MRILLTSNSRYPARIGGNGASRVHDNLAKGLAELGHTVLYAVDEGIAAPLPPGVVASRRGARDADIHHFADYPMRGTPPPRGAPWLHTYHAAYEGEFAPDLAAHFVYCSRAAAERYGSPRWVWNGIDPEEIVYSEAKDGHFLFIASDVSVAEAKGLRTAIAVVERLGARLLVAMDLGAGPLPRAFRSPNAEYIGFVDGARKADVIASARALLFPVQIAEAFGLVAAEAMMSGTPVIGSRNGSLPELIAPGTGFVCDALDDYVAAAERVHEIAPAACRARAMSEFHYRVMTKRYVAEYERELGA